MTVVFVAPIGSGAKAGLPPGGALSSVRGMLLHTLLRPVFLAGLLAGGCLVPALTRAADAPPPMPLLPNQSPGSGLWPAVPIAVPTADAPPAATNEAPNTANSAAVTTANLVFEASRAFDQRFIPLLVAAAESNAAPASAAAEAVLTAWPEFAERCRKASPDDPRLNESLSEIEAALRKAGASLKAGQVVAARESLMSVRLALMQLRARFGVEYLPDYLTRYAQPLEVAIGMVAKLNPTNATRADFMGVREFAVAVRGYWLQFLSAPRVSPVQYAFTPAQLTELQTAVTAANAALKAMEGAFETGSSEGMLTTLAGMKPPYLQVLAVFGGNPGEAPAGK